ncbi:MAG: murein biosynthesis integral membrane protein MurJ [Actinobacteria bacterium]|nr:murein biosynthesis integral membrane protein MurJ [Actinomycetota bacterium]
MSPGPGEHRGAGERRGPVRRRRMLKDNLGVASGTLASRVTGVVRILALNSAMAVSLRDVYLLANNTPNIVYELILGGILTATLVPLFTDHLEHADDTATDAVVSVAGIALAAITVVGAVVAPLLMLLYSSNIGRGVDPAVFRRVGIELSLLFAPQIFFYGAMAIGSALLNARGRYLAAAWTPVLNNVVVIAVLLGVGAAYDAPGVGDASSNRSLLLLLGLGTTSGIIGMAVALLPALRRAGVRVRFRPDLHHPAVRRAVTLSGWTIGYVIANQVAAQVVNVLAKPGSGGVTYYQTAFMFFQLPHGLLAVTLMTTLQPDMARAHSRRDREAFADRLLLGLRLLLLVIVPAAAGALILSPAVLHAHGAAATLRARPWVVPVGDTLAAFAPGLIGFSVYLFVLRGFYARKDTRTPFFLNCVENVLNIVFALILVRPFGVRGLAAAYAIAYTAAAALAGTALIRRTRGFRLDLLRATATRVVASAAAMAFLAFALGRAIGAEGEDRLLVAVAAVTVAGVATYGAAIWAFDVPRGLGLFGRGPIGPPPPAGPPPALRK